MELVQLSPMPAKLRRYQPQPGSWALLVVCKATFVLRPSESSITAHQETLTECDRHIDDDEGRSLYAASDFVPAKRRADILLVGHAFARGGVPTHSLTARLVVGEVDKSVEVFCDRAFTQDGALLQGTRFTQMSLAYERAAGGPETWNPVGIPPDNRDVYGNIAVPNLQLPGNVITSPDETIEPIGFGPIAPSWPLRRDKLGRHVTTFSYRDWHKHPLPPDLSTSYFNAAPLDQQLQILRDDERIVLENLHPEHPRLITSLPGIRPRTFVEVTHHAGPRELSMRCDTLWIDTDRALCTLTWRGQLPLSHRDEQGRVFVAMEQRGHKLSFRDIERMLIDLVADTEDGREDNTVDFSGAEVRPALPFTTSHAIASGAAIEGVHALEDAFAAAGSATTFDATGAAPGSLRSFAPAPASQQVFAPAPASQQVFAPRPASQQAFAVAQVVPAAKAPLSPWAAGLAASVESAPTPRLNAPLHAAPATADEIAAVPSPSPSIGVVAAQAAAAGGVVWAVTRPPSEAPARTPGTDARVPARAPRSEAIDLLFFDPKSLPRIRRKAAWRPLLDALEEKPLDPELDDPALEQEISNVEDRREVFEVLVHGDPCGADGVHKELVEAVRDDGRFVAPLVLVGGELVFPFQELEVLRVTVATVAPLAVSDERLQKAIDAARDFLKNTEPPGLPPLAEGLTTRIRDAYAQGRHPVVPDYLAAHIERTLLEQRHYQRRDVFGERHLRALFHGQGVAQMPAYVPESVAKQLPLLQRFKARFIAELQLAAELQDASSPALRVVALARAAALPQRKAPGAQGSKDDLR